MHKEKVDLVMALLERKVHREMCIHPRVWVWVSHESHAMYVGFSQTHVCAFDGF